MSNVNIKSDPKSVKLDNVSSSTINPATEETSLDTLAQIEYLTEQIQELKAKIPKLVTVPSNDSLRVYTDSSLVYNYEYLFTSASARVMVFDSPIQTQQSAYLTRPSLGF